MNCRKVCNTLSAYLDGELNGVEQLQVRQHLRVCSCCAGEMESLQRTKRLIAGLAAKDPRPGFEDNLIETVHVQATSQPTRLDIHTWWSLLSAPAHEHIRTTVAVSAISVAVVLWATVPFRMPRQRPGSAELALNGPVASQAKILPAAAIPVGGYMTLHRNGEDGQWMSSGPTITPASETYRAEPDQLR